MKTITISRKNFSGDLIVIPRKDYERLLVLAGTRLELERGLQISLNEIKSGKAIGPFKTADELLTSLR